MQLQLLDPATPGFATAIQVVENYLFYLAERRTEPLLKTLQISRDTLAQVINLVQALDPESGQNLAPESVTYVAPDVIADSLELHPSTVSRAAAGKYMLTPNGTREFRSFFARQIDVDSGPGYSASMVQLDMRKMIESEPPEKPLSDRAISQARQGGPGPPPCTVTKYREHMDIPPSTQRRRAL